MTPSQQVYKYQKKPLSINALQSMTTNCLHRCGILLPIWALMALLPLHTSAQNPDNLIPRELLFRQKDRHNVSLSANGVLVFFQKDASGADSSLWYVPLRSPHVERQYKFKGNLIGWIPTAGEGLAVVLNQNNTLALHTVPTPQSTNLRKLDLPDFDSLQFLYKSPRFPNKVVIDLYAKSKERSGIYILDLLSSSLKRIAIRGHLRELALDENFSLVAAIHQLEGGGSALMRRKDGEWLEVFRYPAGAMKYSGSLLSASADGKTIYALDNTGRDKTSLVRIDAATGEVTEIASDPDADLLPLAYCTDPRGQVRAVNALWGDLRRHITDEAIRQDFDFLDKELGPNVCYAGSTSNDSTWLVYTLSAGPASYYHYNRKEQKATALFQSYTHLSGYELGSRKAYEVGMRDGMKLPLHIYVPSGMAKTDGSPKAPLPTLIFVHDSRQDGIEHWNDWEYTRHFLLLANRGYVVINMEFRGTAGLGARIMEAGDRQWGEAMHYDIVDVVTWAIRAGIANRNKIGIFGWAYGGYAANYALGAAPDLFSCGISLNGLSDLAAYAADAGALESLKQQMGADSTAESLERLKQHSPLTYVKDVNRPLLMASGSSSEPAQQQGDRFADALQKAGKTVLYFYYPDEGWQLRQPKSWASFWAIAEAFLHQHLGGRKQSREVDIEEGDLEIMYGADYVEEID
jgi:dipeptidyl aminopeptidase/acylaminoacyl peptidase